MDNILQAITEPRRREILRLTQDVELSAGEIASHFTEVSRPAISQHLKVLTTAGLITMRREGTKRLYRARPEGLAELREFLNQFWGDELQSLKQSAEAEGRSARQHASP